MKGLILAGGYGTRFLPATKTVPKEMFPLIDRPAIDFIVDEFVKSGVKHILIVTSRRKKSLEDYFDREIELETYLNDDNKLKKMESAVQSINDVAIYFIRQQEMKGTGHAVLLGKDFLDSPFVLAFPDDLVFSEIPLAKQIMDIHKQTNKNVLAVKNMEGEDLTRYGIIEPSSTQNNNNYIDVNGIFEKPKKGNEPSNYVSIGRYLLTPDIFPILENGLNKCKHKEYYLTDAINVLANQNKVVAHEFKGKRYDIGEPIGYLKTITEYAMSREDLKDDYINFLNSITLT